MPRTQCSAELAKRSGPLARVQPALDLRLLRRVIVRPSDDVPVSTANLLPLIKRCSQDAETLQRALLLLRELATGGGAPGAPRALIVLAELLDRMPRALAALAPPPLVPLPWLTRATADGRNLVTHQAASAEEYMSAAAESIAACVGTAKVSFSPSGKLPAPGDWATVIAPARVDLAGGWSDTPPICHERGGRVVNLAVLVGGRRPIGARVRRTPGELAIRVSSAVAAPHLVHQHAAAANLPAAAEAGPSSPLLLTTVAQVTNCTDPTDPGALAKAVLVVTRAVDVGTRAPPLSAQLQEAGGGLEIETWSELPHGSGLGTSSILAAALVAAVAAALGRTLTTTSLAHAVLKVEQRLTTGGGWQDQLGGMLGGAKLCTCRPMLPLHVECEPLRLSEECVQLLDGHLELLYTGHVRQAKHLLRDVLRRWLLGRPQSVSNVERLLRTADKMATALRADNVVDIGRHLAEYWQQKKQMCNGAEPDYVRALLDVLYREDLILGASLTGAGGGGFLLVVTREPGSRARLQAALAAGSIEGVEFHDVAVDDVGMQLSLGGASVPIEHWKEWLALL